MIGKRTEYRILVEKPEEKRPLGRRKYKWVDNIEMGIREMEWGGMDWTDLAYDRDQWRVSMNTVTKLRVP
jgi:hypothetical protein